MRITSGNIIWKKETLVPPDPVSCDCCQGNHVAFMPHVRHVVYVNNGEALSCVQLDTNRIIDIPLATNVWKVYYYALNAVLYVEKDHLRLHLVDMDNNTNELIEYPNRIENTLFCIDNVTVLDSGRFIVLASCSIQLVILLNIELPRVFFLIASTSIDSSVSPCFMKELNMFVFSWNNKGELLLVLLDRLSPSTEQTPIHCKEHHRIRLDCEKITHLAAIDSSLIVCDDRGCVTELRVFCRVCSKQKEKEILHTYYMVAAVTTLRLGGLVVVLRRSVSHVCRR